MNWQATRDEMPITRHWAFFDHAAVAPLPARARDAMTHWAADLADQGDTHHGDWMKRVEDVRGLFGRLLHVDPIDVAFVKNTSEGIGIVAEGFPWQSGDNVVIAEEEYPANVYPWMNLVSRGVEVRRVASRGARILLDDLQAAISPRTRIVSLSWVEFASGYRNDLAAVGNLCRERGVLFLVDAIQGLGVFPIDVAALPIDFLAADGHKWLLGPEGAGILYVRRELVERLHPVGIGWNSVVGSTDFSRIRFELKPNAGRWESGTLNVAGIHALGASLAWMLDLGIDQIAARLLALTSEFCAAVESLSTVHLFSSRQEAEWSPIVSLSVNDQAQLRPILQHCHKHQVQINQRGGRLRVSPHFYNSPEELEKLVQLLRGPYT
jgi:cysteine desulfurase / selenocysteine lyase